MESAATALHEAIEALRWARDLISSGHAKPSEIGIAAASPGEYDDQLLTLRSDANIDLCFVHGTNAMATHDGQAAALADILARGLTHMRLRRLATLCRDSGIFEGLPEHWLRVIPVDAPMSSNAAWTRLISNLQASDWPGEVDHAPHLREIVGTLSGGLDKAEEIGRAVLPHQAFKMWRKALQNGPAAAISMTLAGLRVDDSMAAPNAIAWMPGSSLAASPRKFVRLLGMTSRAWPRLASEDRLLPDHVVKTAELDPLPIGAADRRDFATILATTDCEVILSRPRRDGEGRQLGKSPLLHGIAADEIYLQRNRTPLNAMSEADRLLARPEDYSILPIAASAEACWVNWLLPIVTAHDGLVRADHPMVKHILARDQSATSLRKLLRDPLGFLWRYGLGLKEQQMGAEPLTLDHRDYGTILHAALEGAVKRLEIDGGLASAMPDAVEKAVAAALSDAAEAFEAKRSVPPPAIWRRTIDELLELATAAVRPEDEVPLAGQRSFAEVSFGDPEHEGADDLPWSPSSVVEISGSGFRISGAIDRLDLSGNGHVAGVSDYKAGKVPKIKKDEVYVLDGGKELQRCLYSFAVKALLGAHVEVQAALRYPRYGATLVLDDGDDVLTELTGYLVAARSNLLAGRAVPGKDTADEYNDLAFALPANAKKSYYRRKGEAATAALGDAAAVWEAK